MSDPATSKKSLDQVTDDKLHAAASSMEFGLWLGVGLGLVAAAGLVITWLLNHQ